MKKAFVTILGLAACLVACNKVEAPQVMSDNQVHFQLEGLYNTYVFKSPIADDTHVGLFAGGSINKSNIDATVDITGDNKTLTGFSMYWPVSEEAVDFWAMYPYNSGLSVTENKININLNADTYDNASDFLTAHANAVAWKQNVVLPFNHPFTKIVYTITNSVPDDAVNTITVSNIKVEGTLNIKTDEVAVTGSATTLADGIRNLTNAGQVYTYSAIILPQTANPLITVTMHSGATYTYSLNNDFTFEKGKSYAASINITDSGHSESTTARTSVASSFSVNEWVTSDPSLNSAAGSQSGSTTSSWWYVEGTVGIGATAPGNWTVHVPMNCTGANTWEITGLKYDNTIGDNPGIKLRYVANPAGDDWTINYGNGTGSNKYSMELTGTSSLSSPWLLHSGENAVPLGASGVYTITWNSSTNYINVSRTGDL